MRLNIGPGFPPAKGLPSSVVTASTSLVDEESRTYLRPETAQGMFYNFRNVLDTTRVKVPFGLAQLGKGFRNEITPRNFIFRSREFEMMEVEFFVHPSEANDWYQLMSDTSMPVRSA